MNDALFAPTTISGLRLDNRLVRSATWEGLCDQQGRPTARLIDCYQTLARGKVGLIITGYAFVRADGKQLPGKMGMHSDLLAPAMREMVEAVHRESGRICVQLVHAGGQTDSATAGGQPVAPSAVAVPQFPELPRALTREEIAELVQAFADAACRAMEWGFDAVQLHGAHGYLINQFLSPLTNRREDEYGGSAENRSRFVLEVYRAVRRAVGEDFPVLIKLNGSDFQEGGLELADACFAAAALDREGIDAIEVSGGTVASGERSPVRVKIEHPEQELYNLDLALAVKERVGCPVMTVGGVRSLEKAGEALERGIDFLSLARPLIREPGLVRRWLEGDLAPARCISCNGCFKPGLKGEGVRCVQEQPTAP